MKKRVILIAALCAVFNCPIILSADIAFQNFVSRSLLDRLEDPNVLQFLTDDERAVLKWRIIEGMDGPYLVLSKIQQLDRINRETDQGKIKPILNANTVEELLEVSALPAQ